VQKATAEILNAIYEQDFLDCSYGFRPGRGQHQALDEVRRVSNRRMVPREPTRTGGRAAENPKRQAPGSLPILRSSDELPKYQEVLSGGLSYLEEVAQPAHSWQRDDGPSRFPLLGATPATLNRKNLHAYRLKIKELRYVLETADDPGNQDFIDKLGEVKDAIGEWHDWAELIAIAGDVLDHKANCKLLREVKAISTCKFQNTLSLTNKMRRDYLRFSERIKNRVSTSKRGPAVQSVLEAASAVVSWIDRRGRPTVGTEKVYTVDVDNRKEHGTCSETPPNCQHFTSDQISRTSCFR